MYFIALKTNDFIHLESFKQYVKQLGFKYRFDYRMKRWELYCTNNKATKKRIKAIKKYAIKLNCEVWEWSENSPTYKESVYNKKK